MKFKFLKITLSWKILVFQNCFKIFCIKEKKYLQWFIAIIWYGQNCIEKSDHLDHITKAQIQFNLAKCLICYHAILLWKNFGEPSWLRINILSYLILILIHKRELSTMLQKYARTQKRPIIRKKCTCASLAVTNTGPNI